MQVGISRIQKTPEKLSAQQIFSQAYHLLISRFSTRPCYVMPRFSIDETKGLHGDDHKRHGFCVQPLEGECQSGVIEKKNLRYEVNTWSLPFKGSWAAQGKPKLQLDS